MIFMAYFILFVCFYLFIQLFIFRPEKLNLILSGIFISGLVLTLPRYFFFILLLFVCSFFYIYISFINIFCVVSEWIV